MPVDAADADWLGPEIPVPPGGTPACGCERPLYRTVLDVRWHLTLQGCLRCGRTIGYIANIDEPHPHIVELVGIVPLRLEQPLGRWLARWPRRTRPTPPPRALPEQLESWGQAQRAMLFTSATPFAEVLAATVGTSRLAGWMASDTLAARTDLAAALAAVVAAGRQPARRIAMSYVAGAALPADTIADLVAQESRNIHAALDSLHGAGAAVLPQDIYNDTRCLREAAPRALDAGQPARDALAALSRDFSRFPHCRIAAYCRAELEALLRPGGAASRDDRGP